MSDHDTDHGVPLRQLLALTPEECWNRLRSRPVGRVVFVDSRGPVALPVNYVVDRDSVVFRTAATSSVLASSYAEQVSFEVDDYDAANRQGWSVLATGHVTPVNDPADLRHVEMLRVTPWAEGPRTNYLRLEVRAISGRRLVPDDTDLPPG